MPPPADPKIYHIVHIDRLASILAEGCLHCDAVMMERENAGTAIGMSDIKQRRLGLPIDCQSGLRVGDCVPFYFCPRSVMLYLLHMGNHPNLTYRGGQQPIIHLESDLRKAVAWAEASGRRWAFTLSNAGAFYFEDRCNLNQLGEINWSAVQTDKWSGAGVSSLIKEGKQAELLVERSFPWRLMERIGVHGRGVAQQVANATRDAEHRPRIEIRRDWYY
jgi:ssDNA thymidine ADP-ribosyltransferase, DarT